MELCFLLVYAYLFLINVRNICLRNNYYMKFKEILMNILAILVLLSSLIAGILALLHLDSVIKKYMDIAYNKGYFSYPIKQPEWYIRLVLKCCLIFLIIYGLVGLISILLNELNL